jgi:hypothetical protein
VRAFASALPTFMAALNAGYLFAQSLIVEGLQPNASARSK